MDEAEAKAALSRRGVPVPPSRVAFDPASAVAAADELGYPVVVKTLGVAHKTEVGGVRLALTGGAAVAFVLWDPPQWCLLAALVAAGVTAVAASWTIAWRMRRNLERLSKSPAWPT